jgi:alpha-L-fucosidase
LGNLHDDGQFVGYKSWENKWKSPETLIRNLCDIASKGGNYLLNIGPDALGEVPQPSVDALKAIGVWMKTNSEAIYATKASPLGSFDWGRCTQKTKNGNTVLYFSVFNWPATGKLEIPGVTQKIKSAKLLADRKNLKTIRKRRPYGLSSGESTRCGSFGYKS